MARPRKFNKVGEMEKAIKGYFKKQERRDKPYTIQGLCLALGFNSRKSLLNYEGYTDDSDIEFLHTIKEARLKVEENKVEGLISGEYSASGVIFDLKNNHDHKDKQVIENVKPEEMDDEELDDKIQRFKDS